MICKYFLPVGSFFRHMKSFLQRKKLSFFLLLLMLWCPKKFLQTLGPEDVPPHLFFSFLAAPQLMEFPGQGSASSLSCNLSHSCGNAGFLTHCIRLGSNLHPRAPEMLPILLYHSGNSKMFPFTFFQDC